MAAAWRARLRRCSAGAAGAAGWGRRAGALWAWIVSQAGWRCLLGSCSLRVHVDLGGAAWQLSQDAAQVRGGKRGLVKLHGSVAQLAPLHRQPQRRQLDSVCCWLVSTPPTAACTTAGSIQCTASPPYPNSLLKGEAPVVVSDSGRGGLGAAGACRQRCRRRHEALAGQAAGGRDARRAQAAHGLAAGQGGGRCGEVVVWHAAR